jgi:hypothetical protein
MKSPGLSFEERPYRWYYDASSNTPGFHESETYRCSSIMKRGQYLRSIDRFHRCAHHRNHPLQVGTMDSRSRKDCR